MIYQLKVSLTGIEPEIWRRVQVDQECSFLDLHDIIQFIMPWEDSHSYEFRFKNVVVTDGNGDDQPVSDGIGIRNDFDTTLFELFENEKKCVYTYDFGDEWRHTIKLEKKLSPDPETEYPVCTGGARACPPDDCGGPFEYMRLVDIMADPSHPEYEERREWLMDYYDEPWDPEYFDIDEANEELEEIRIEFKFGLAEQPPDIEQWRRLYETAIKIKAVKPWITLTNKDYIAVKPYGYSEHVYYVTMGLFEDNTAVAAYMGDKALYSLNMPRAYENSLMTEVGRHDCVACYFGDREEVDKEDREILRQLGIKFRGRGEWIFFRSMKPGHLPWRMNKNDAKIMCDTLEQYLEAYNDFAAGKCDVNFRDNDILTRELHSPDQPWVNGTIKGSEFALVSEKTEITDELLIARLKRYKKNMLSIELEMFHLPTPIQEYRLQRPFFPKLAFTVDSQNFTVSTQRILTPEDDTPMGIIEMLCEYIENLGIPRSISICTDEMSDIISDFCQKLGIRVEKKKKLQGAAEVAESLLSFMETEGFDPYSDD